MRSRYEFLMFSPVLELAVSTRMAFLSTPSSSALLAKSTASGSSQASVKLPRPPLKRILGARPSLERHILESKEVFCWQF